MAVWGKLYAADSGSTGNNTHTSKEIPPEWENSAGVFVVEAVGATPTVTYKWQYSLDEYSVTDANATWFDLDYVLPGTADTVANATRARTAVGADIVYPFIGVGGRFVRRFRLVTTLNTNVTYRAYFMGADRAA